MRLLFLAMMLLAAPAAAAGSRWPVRSTASGCIATTTVYEGASPTTMGVGLTVDGQYQVVLQNSRWTTVEDKVYDMYLLIDKYAVQGQASGAKNGSLVIDINREIVSKLVSGRNLFPFLKINADKEQVLEMIPLAGSAAAVSEIRSCVSDVQRADRRSEHVPADPFAASSESGGN